MDFNLIHEEWIPVKRESGKAQKIAPYQITSGPEDPIIAFNAPRPDFNGALAQFMIGLLQTTAAPEDEGEWEEWFNDPPAPEELKKKFATVEHAFNLGGDGPRFMQDYSLTDGEQKEINVLLLETPGAKALKENTDHFIKRNSLNRECMACCAISLFALQTNAPSGGAGHRTSLRGGGPLTTLIAGERTWQTIWLNVIGGDEFANLPGNMSLEDDIYKFPWLAATRTSEAKTGADTFPEHAHPVQMFWATPRRIRINLNSRTQGECNLCGESSDFNVTSFITKNYGVNYEGAWTHPLSPHRKQKDGLILPLHANPGGLSYRNWLGLAYADNENAVEPANVIHHYFNSARYIESSSYKLWAFGYDMEKMKARCWYEGMMPLILVEKSMQERFEKETNKLILAAGEVASNTRSCVKSAWFSRPKDAKGDTSYIDKSFWSRSEPDFYKSLHHLKSLLESGEDTELARARWHNTICRLAMSIFDEFAASAPVEESDPKRVALARRDLARFNNGKKIVTSILELPKKENSKEDEK